MPKTSLNEVYASPLRERPASHRPKRAEKATLKDQGLYGGFWKSADFTCFFIGKVYICGVKFIGKV